MVVIEMNPRVSRSCALASKATGYPIAKIAAKLALGYTLDELRNDITRDTPASFEPTLDYVVVKIPRFNFEKFPHADRTLTTSMRSVGEVMAIGRTFREAYLKALRSHGGRPRWRWSRPSCPRTRRSGARCCATALRVPRPERPWYVAQAFREGMSVEEVHELSAIDPWFLRHIRGAGAGGAGSSQEFGKLDKVPDDGAARGEGARLLGPVPGAAARAAPRPRCARTGTRAGIRPVYKRVDTCAAEFEAYTPYLYSTYEEEDEAPPTDRQKVLILGSGPIRIGQGIEFDYCCVHAAFALREAGYETVMVNCNPETVSTDYDTSDRLYFEPLTIEDVLEVVAAREAGGRHRAVRRADAAAARRCRWRRRACRSSAPPPDAIDRAEDRERFAQLIEKLGLKQPENGVARSHEEAFTVAERIGYPVMVRPSLRAGRPGDGGRLRPAEPRAVHARGGERVARAPGADRPLPQGRHRGGPGPGGGPDGRGAGGRRAGAHRGGGRALGRRGLHAAAALAVAGPGGADEGPGHRAGAASWAWWA